MMWFALHTVAYSSTSLARPMKTAHGMINADVLPCAATLADQSVSLHRPVQHDTAYFRLSFDMCSVFSRFSHYRIL